MSLKERVIGLIRLWRPPLLILGFVAAYGLLQWSGSTPDFIKSGLIVSAIGFGNLAFNTMNEIRDLETDKVNKPHKPLPKKAVSIRTAYLSTILFWLLSVISLGFLILYYGLFYSVGFLGYLTALVYNGLRWKGVFGNICLGTTYGIAGLMATYPRNPHMFFCLAFAIFTVSYNVLVQWQDMEADKTSGVRTLPLQLDRFAYVFSIMMAGLNFFLLSWLYFVTRELFLIIFILASLLVPISMYAVKTGNRRLIQWNLRRIGRLLLTLGFLGMIFT